MQPQGSAAGAIALAQIHRLPGAKAQLAASKSEYDLDAVYFGSGDVSYYLRYYFGFALAVRRVGQ